MASSPDWKDPAVERSARCAAQDIGSTYCLANVAIRWPAKIVDVIDYRSCSLLSWRIISAFIFTPFMERTSTVMSAETAGCTLHVDEASAIVHRSLVPKRS